MRALNAWNVHIVDARNRRGLMYSRRQEVHAHGYFKNWLNSRYICVIYILREGVFCYI